MSGKTSFKKLLAKSGSNPTVSISNVRAQKERVQQLKTAGGGSGGGSGSDGPPSKVARTSAAPVRPPPTAVMPVAAPTAPAAPPPVATATAASFMPAGMFAGRRPGFIFQLGELGLGYYRDSTAPPPPSSAAAAEPTASTAAPIAAATSAADADAEPAAAGALPSGFFDNPQLDPANKSKEVAPTKKQQSLNEAMDEFTALVKDDLKAAEQGDEVAEEDEEEAKLREAISVARELEGRVAGLRERASAVAAAGSAPAAAPAPAGQPVDDDDDDDDDEEEDALALLNSDWRAKGV